MRSVPSAVAAAMAEDHVFPVTLFELGNNTILRYNSTDQAVLWNSHVWVPRPTSHGTSKETLGAGLAEHTIDVDNYDQALTAWAVAHNPIGYNSTIYEGNTSGIVNEAGFLLLIEDYAWVEFSGRNTSIRLEQQFSITIKSRYDMAKARGPSREQSGLCRFRGLANGINGFKGRNCGYAGSALACDFTYATCTAYGNQQRFGGFPDLKERINS